MSEAPIDVTVIVGDVYDALAAGADPAQANPMSAYLKNQFPCLGVKAGPRRQAQRASLNLLTQTNGDTVVDFARRCWQQPHREMQYVGCDALRKHSKVLEPNHLDPVGELITTKSWWDTVDSLAVHTVGSLVRRHQQLAHVMDRWVHHDNIWLARTAILHQLSYKENTDTERLFGYATTRAGDSEFFIRKAIGWALRQYARVDPLAVRQFVSDHEHELSGLTKREAMKHLG